MQLSNQKSWLFAFCLTALFASWDFTDRIMIPTQVMSSNTELDMSYVFSEKNTMGQSDAEILNLYTGFDKPISSNSNTTTVKPSKNSGMTAEQMKSQQGRLDKFFIGDYTYVLSGVFYEQSRFAVLLQTNIKTNKVKEIKVYQGENIGEYHINDISEQRIVFSEHDRTVELSIF